MTGGSAEGFRANKDLARVAQELGIPVGMGSIRVLFEHDHLFEHFHLKRYAPSVPVMANLGAVQLRDLPHDRIIETLRRLEVDALAVHLNAGQELYQSDGDRDFRGLKDALWDFFEVSPIPVVVKETGFGLSPSLVADLLDAGAAYVNVAGSGGTNWISVESYRLEGDAYQVSAREFEDWGLPTGQILAAIREKGGPNLHDHRILASGGLRTGMDVAKSIALGAELAGLALPFIRALKNGGREAVAEQIRGLAMTLTNVMMLTGSRNLTELKRTPLRFDESFRRDLKSLLNADNERVNLQG